MKPPKIGKEYHKIIALGCGLYIDDCKHGYDWECDECPCTIEYNRKCIAEILSQGNHAITCKACNSTYIAWEGFYQKYTDKYGFRQWDSVCKQCRSKESFLYELNKRKEPVYKPRKNIETLRRETKEGFEYYMKTNPHYFKSVFSLDPTDENIKKSFRELNR